ncbi:uncharacterized protein LOC134238829 [Saccostrea cucullata]|uniref:uncharacterized protein LOC134238829 n=1 Tax=Saccostrea cuccullata TaxID=36930 RepID=UPI002ED371D2
MVDGIPIISQAKSLVQYMSGDSEGAKKTQDNFTKQCLIVSQLRSAVEICNGDVEAAKETQSEFVKNMSGLADAFPVVGHVKGVVHYAAGDREGGDNAMKSASRTTGAIIGGAVGSLAGPAGAYAGGVAGAVTMDAIITGADSAIHGEDRLHGSISQFEELRKNPSNAGKWFDVVASTGFDALVGGYAGTKVCNSIKNAKTKCANSKTQSPVKSLLQDQKAHEVFDGHNKQVGNNCTLRDQANAETIKNHFNAEKTSKFHKNVPNTKPSLNPNPKKCQTPPSNQGSGKHSRYNTAAKLFGTSAAFSLPSLSLKNNFNVNFIVKKKEVNGMGLKEMGVVCFAAFCAFNSKRVMLRLKRYK